MRVAKIKVSQTAKLELGERTTPIERGCISLKFLGEVGTWMA
jgi:hypothetical protein